MIKVLLVTITLIMAGCVLVNPMTILDTIKVIVDNEGNILNVVRTPVE